MAKLWTPPRQILDPTQYEVDWSHPLARGLLYSFLFDPVGRPFDLARVRSSALVATGTPGVDVLPTGIAGKFTSDDAQYWTVGQLSTTTYPGITVLAWCYPVYAGVDYATHYVVYTNKVMISTTHGGGGGASWRYGTTIYTNSANTALTKTGLPWRFTSTAVTWDVNDKYHRQYIDGVEVNSGALAGDTVKIFDTVLRIGSDSSNHYNGRVGPVYLFSRGLTAGEIGQLYAEPFCFLKETKRKTYSFPAVTQTVGRTIKARTVVDNKRCILDPTQYEVDWSHPLARDLKRCYLFDPAGVPKDISRLQNIAAVATNGPTSAVGVLGHCGSFDKASSQYWTISSTSAATYTGVTALNWSFPKYPGSFGSFDVVSSAAQWLMIIRNSGTSNYLHQAYVKTNLGSSYGGMSGNITYDWHQFALTWSADDPNLRNYVDGKEAVAATARTGATVTPFAANHTFGYYADYGYFNGLINHAVVWTRGLSASEILQLYAEPFCFLRPLKRVVYSFGAAGEQPQEATAGIAEATAAGISAEALQEQVADCGLASATAQAIDSSAENAYSDSVELAQAVVTGIDGSAENTYSATSELATAIAAAMDSDGTNPYADTCTLASAISAAIDATYTNPYDATATLAEATALGIDAVATNPYTDDVGIASSIAVGLSATNEQEQSATCEIALATASALDAEAGLGQTTSAEIASATAVGLSATAENTYSDTVEIPNAVAAGIDAGAIQGQVTDCVIASATSAALDASAENLYSATAEISSAQAFALDAQASQGFSAFTEIASAIASGLIAGFENPYTDSVGISSATANGLEASGDNPYPADAGLAIVTAAAIAASYENPYTATAGIASTTASALDVNGGVWLAATAELAASIASAYDSSAINTYSTDCGQALVVANGLASDAENIYTGTLSIATVIGEAIDIQGGVGLFSNCAIAPSNLQALQVVVEITDYRIEWMEFEFSAPWIDFDFE